MATVKVNPSRVVLTLSHEEAGRLSDMLAAQAASEQWAEALFNVLAGDGAEERASA
jgi:hypothetical protein